MGAYDRDYWKEPPIHQNNYNTYSPQIKDYIAWFMIPGLLAMITCGIGGIFLMIVWACDSKNMARANYFRAQLILMGIGLTVIFAISLLTTFSLTGLFRNLR